MLNRRSQRGFVLIAFYMFFVVLLVQAGALLAQTTAEMRSAQRLQNQIRAHYLAEAAMDRAIASLRSPLFSQQVVDRGNRNDTEVRYTPLGQGGYEADVDPAPGRPLGWYRIGAVGYSPNRQVAAAGFVSRSLESYVRISPADGPPRGLVGDHSVQFHGSLRVDSYNSASRSFQPTQHGLIGSNGVRKNTIRLKGSSAIYGDVLAGPGARRDAIRVKGASVITGVLGNASDRFTVTPVQEPVGRQVLRLERHQTLTLPGGTYHFRRVSVKDGARLTFTGPAILYVGSFSVKKASVATSRNLPANLRIHVTGGGVSVRDGSTLYAGIYAPRSKVTLKGSNRLFGFLVGKKIRGHGSLEVWFDEALSGSGPGLDSNEVQLRSWTETP